VGQAIHDLTGAVGRVVVDDQYIEVGRLAQNRRYDRLDIVPFVVRWQDDDRPVGVGVRVHRLTRAEHTVSGEDPREASCPPPSAVAPSSTATAPSRSVTPPSSSRMTQLQTSS